MYYIGIDVGGMSIKLGLLNSNGVIINKSILRVDYNNNSPERVIFLMKEKIEELCNFSKVRLSELSGIGIGCPGVCDSEKGIVLNAPNIKWSNVPVVEMFKDMRIPTYICNDANAAIMGEYKFGEGKGYQNLVLITLGTGVGGGIIINGKLYEGEGFTGAELGHMTLVVDGKDCGCGHKGCFEAYASVSALIRDSKEAMEKDKKSLMWQYCLDDINQVNGRTAFETALQGDKTANMVVDNYIKYLGEGIRSILNIFRPECLIIGGGLSGQKENLTSRLEKYLDSVEWGLKNTPHAKIVVSNFGNDAGIVGAASLAMKE